MANVAEMGILNDALGDLTRTLLARRGLRAREAEDLARNKLGERMAALHEREAGSREADYADLRANRKLSLEAQKEHQLRLEMIQKEGNADKRNKMMFDFLTELNKNGQLTDEGISAMEQQFNKQFGSAGLGVKLFRAQPTDEGVTGYDEDPVTGHRFARRGKVLLNSGINPGKIPGKTPTETVKYDPVTGEPIERSVSGPFKPAPPPAPEPFEDFSPGASTSGGGREGGLFKGGPASRASYVRDAMRELESGAAAPAWGPPSSTGGQRGVPPPSPVMPLPGAATAPTGPSNPMPAGIPPKPAGKTDAQILREAADAIERNPKAADAIRARLQAWSLIPGQ